MSPCQYKLNSAIEDYMLHMETDLRSLDRSCGETRYGFMDPAVKKPSDTKFQAAKQKILCSFY